MEFQRLVKLTADQATETALAAMIGTAMNRYLIFTLQKPNATVGEKCAMAYRAYSEVVAMLPPDHPTRDWIEEAGAQLAATIQREGG